MKISIVLFLIASLGVLAYSNSLGNDFIWDDNSFVVKNDFIKNLKFIPLYFVSKEALSEGGLAAENYRPFLPLTYALDYFFWKLNPLGYHISNLLFHIANSVLLFYLVLLLTGNRFTGLFTSLFFLTHPIQTESVSWISGRADVLFLFFYLAALIAYIRYTKEKHLFLYFGSLLLFSCSLLSKEMAASLPLIIILCDFFYTKKERIGLRAIRYFAFFLILEVYVILRFNIIGRLAQTGYWTGDIYTTLLTMAKGILYYIRLLIYPVGLCADYLRFPISCSVKEPQTFLSILAIMLLMAGAIKLAKKKRDIAFSIFWFFITLAPAVNIIPIKILIAERFLYLPSIGYCFVIAASIMSLSDKFKRTPILKHSFFYFATFLVCAYLYLTNLRNLDWSDEIVFWKKNAEIDPNNERAYYNLAVAYLARENNLDRAYEESRKALEITPQYSHPRIITASYYVQKSQFEDAVKELEYALDINPAFLQAHIFLGNIYAFRGKHDLAYNEYKKALAFNPDSLDPKIAIATLYLVKGDVDSGIREFKKILKEPPTYHSRPIYAAIYLRLGELYFSKGNNEIATRVWRKVYEDFKDQIWFNEISKFLIGKSGLEHLLQKTEPWQPKFKAICYYYIGVKKEMDKDFEGAKMYYRKSMDVATPTLAQIKMLVTKRLEKLEKNPSPDYKIVR